MNDNYADKSDFEKIKIAHLLERKEHIAKELKLRVALLKEHRKELQFLLQANASSVERIQLLVKHKSEILELRVINEDHWTTLLYKQKEELKLFSNSKSNKDLESNSDFN